MLVAQDPSKRQEVHDQLAAATHQLLQSAGATGAGAATDAAHDAAGVPAEEVSILNITRWLSTVNSGTIHIMLYISSIGSRRWMTCPVTQHSASLLGFIEAPFY